MEPQFRRQERNLRVFSRVPAQAEPKPPLDREGHKLGVSERGEERIPPGILQLRRIAQESKI